MKKSLGILQTACLVILFCSLFTTPVFARNTGHVWGPWIIDKQPTCVREGHKHRICKKYPDSPHRDDAIIPKLKSHTYKRETIQPLCANPGQETYSCIYCDYSYTERTSPPLGHDYGKWTVIRKATATQEGLLQKTCANDPSHIKEKLVPMLTPVSQTTEAEIFKIIDIVLPVSCVSSSGLFACLIYRDTRVISWDRRRKSAFLLTQGGMLK